MKKTLLNLCMAAAAVVLIAQPAFAGKPGDADNPNAETVCDGIDAPAKGICVAYCESQDCDGAGSENPSCSTLRDNWVRVTGSDEFPCEAPSGACPCYTKEEILSALSNSPAACELTETPYAKLGVKGQVTRVLKTSGVPAFSVHDWPDDIPDLQLCDIEQNGTYEYELLDEEHFQFCMDEVQAVVQSLNLECQ